MTGPLRFDRERDVAFAFAAADVLLKLIADLNAEVEHRTARDTTEGVPKPIVSRRAKRADTVCPALS